MLKNAPTLAIRSVDASVAILAQGTSFASAMALRSATALAPRPEPSPAPLQSVDLGPADLDTDEALSSFWSRTSE